MLIIIKTDIFACSQTPWGLYSAERTIYKQQLRKYIKLSFLKRNAFAVVGKRAIFRENFLVNVS